jgi:hypothetical protein
MRRRTLAYLDDADVLKLLLVAWPPFTERNQAVLAVMFYLGLKPSEARDLDTSDIRFEDEVIYITGPAGRKRHQTLDAETTRYLKQYLAVRKPVKNRALFISQEKSRLHDRTIRTMLKGYALKVGLDPKRVHPHVIRHSYIVRQLKKQLPTDIIEEVLGLTPPASPSSVIELRNSLERLDEHGDRATAHIRQAWRDVFGRDANPSAGYHAACLAVEAAAAPIIPIKGRRSTLGLMLIELKDDWERAKRGQPQRWRLPTILPKGGLPSIIAMMDLLWNGQHDRHATADDHRPLRVTAEEAQLALPLANALVQWFRLGLIRKA